MSPETGQDLLEQIARAHRQESETSILFIAPDSYITALGQLVEITTD